MNKYSKHRLIRYGEKMIAVIKRQWYRGATLLSKGESDKLCRVVGIEHGDNLPMQTGGITQFIHNPEPNSQYGGWRDSRDMTVDALPKLMQERLAVLKLLPAEGGYIEGIGGMAVSINERIYYVCEEEE